jgi:hypothetical protein
MIRRLSRAAPPALRHRVIAPCMSCGIAGYRQRTSWLRCEVNIQIRRGNELTRQRDEGAPSSVHGAGVEPQQPDASSACAGPHSTAALTVQSSLPLLFEMLSPVHRLQGPSSVASVIRPSHPRLVRAERDGQVFRPQLVNLTMQFDRLEKLLNGFPSPRCLGPEERIENPHVHDRVGHWEFEAAPL